LVSSELCDSPSFSSELCDSPSFSSELCNFPLVSSELSFELDLFLDSADFVDVVKIKGGSIFVVQL
jgi:hypothetical protein